MLIGKQSWKFERAPYIIGTSAIVGPEEGKGPLAADYDLIHEQLDIYETSWEKAERKLLEQATSLAITKANVNTSHIEYFIGGDLMNQITSNSFAARTLSVPYIGVFGACSTSMESLALAAMIIDSGNAHYALAGTCSHNCTAEKQFRYPTEYGSQKPPTAQFTVTGAGAAVLCNRGSGPRVTTATIGKVIDLGITDPFNMGAAMAPAAVDTLRAHFTDTGREASYYDMIVTGDLSAVGHPIASDLLRQSGVSMEHTVFDDCGLMIFDRNKQAVQAGGSGCGCSAVVTYGHLMKRMIRGQLKRMLIVATGSLLSPLSYQQGESIPCIAHAVSIEMDSEGE